MTREEINRIASIYEEARKMSRSDIDTSRDFDPMMDLAIGGYSRESAIEKMTVSHEDYENLVEYARFVGGDSGINWDLVDVEDENPAETVVDNTADETEYIVTDGKVSNGSVDYGPALYWWPKNTVFMDMFREYSDVESATLYQDGKEMEHFDSVTKRTHSNVIDWNDSWD